MILSITNMCNENCSHCMMNSCSTGKHMKSEVFSKAVDCLKVISPPVLSITGGEPTLHPQFDMIVDHIMLSLPNTIVSILSNGSFHTNEGKCNTIKGILNTFNNIHILQIRTDKRFYSNYEDIIKNKDKIKAIHPKIKVWEGNIDLMPFGRALINHKDEINWRRKPACSNPILVAKQIEHDDIASYIRILQIQAKTFCKPMIDVEGNIRLGETDSCLKVGNVSEIFNETLSTEGLMGNIKNSKPCDKCGLVNNCNTAEKAILFS